MRSSYTFVRALGMWLAVLGMISLIVAAFVVGLTLREFAAGAGLLTSLVLLYDVFVVRPARRGGRP